MDYITKAQASASDVGAPGGRILTACNATPGTGIAQAVSASYDETKALVNIGLNGTTAPGTVLVPQWIRLISTVAPASGTSAAAAISIYANDVPGGGTVLTQRSAVGGGSAGTGTTVRAGAVALAAGTLIRSRFQLRSAIPVVGDEMLILFGGGAATDTLGGTTAVRSVTVVPRIAVIGTAGSSPGIALHVWYPSNAVTPASWEVEVCWREIGG